jgi:hypothetical protein
LLITFENEAFALENEIFEGGDFGFSLFDLWLVMVPKRAGILDGQGPGFQIGQCR